MDYIKKYNDWLDNVVEKELLDELLAMKGNDKLIKERFLKDISFGTGGLRGIIGAGTDNMNVYTIKKAVQGFSDFIKNAFPNKTPSIAISYDSRIKSDIFAKEAAKVLAGNGITAYITDELMPTPFLSFMVRELSCDGGIMITASHNPSIYNGLKAYNKDGAQLADKASAMALNYINKVDVFNGIKSVEFEKAIKEGKINYTENNLFDLYIETIAKHSFFIPNDKKADNISVAFTPLHGAGLKPVKVILKKLAVKEIHIVKEQEQPDGNFTGAPMPNPELEATMQKGIELAIKTNSDVLIGTDPDADRLGVAAKNGDDFTLLTGNEVGVLLFDYIIKNLKTLPENPYAVRSIVSSSLFDKIAKDNNIMVKEVLTGFKYIADFIKELDDKKINGNYLFGFEESCGYLYGSYVRDKDAVSAAMLVSEMVSFYKSNNTNLLNVLSDLYDKYGYHYNHTSNYTYEGLDGSEKIESIMNSLRNDKPSIIDDVKVISYKDYMTKSDSKADLLPMSDVIIMDLEDGSKLIVRPSGTEPKIKFYYSILAENKKDAMEKTKRYNDYVEKTLNLK